MKTQFLWFLFVVAFAGTSIANQKFSFSTAPPDGRMAMASRPESLGKIEIEAADDFVLNVSTKLDSATFTGLLPAGATVGEVRVEIYRVFPKDSDVGRTSGPPTFSTPQVPTRVNSPSDVEFADRDTASGNLTFTTTVLNQSFTAANSVLNGIHPLPGVLTGGEGPVTVQEVQFSVDFSTPFELPADHSFFVPQVEVTSGGDFFWLSTTHPLFVGDLQAWMRNSDLDPDWLRVGTDIVGNTTFNGSFSLAGRVPESGSTMALLACAAGSLLFLRRRMRAQIVAPKAT